MSKRIFVRKIVMVLLVVLFLPVFALAGETELTWYGHSAFKIVTPSGKVLLIDPWIENPLNKNGKEDIAKLERVDLILVTHGHSDHVGNAAEIGKKTGAKLVGTFDLVKAMVMYGGYPKGQFGFDTIGSVGGEISMLDGEVKITFTNALHGSSIDAVEGTQYAGLQQYAGSAGGFLVKVKNGHTFYHTGDTDVFSDMALISQFSKVDVMLACIGDRFTMGPERAALAVKLVKPGTVIPMHYATFPVLTGTPEAFGKALKKQRVKTKMREMRVGETLKF